MLWVRNHKYRPMQVFFVPFRYLLQFAFFSPFPATLFEFQLRILEVFRTEKKKVPSCSWQG